MVLICPGSRESFLQHRTWNPNLSSSPLYTLVSEFTRGRWLISHEAFLFPRDMELDNNQPGRPGVGLLEVESEAHAARQASLPL